MMPAESKENPLLKKGNSDAFFKENVGLSNICYSEFKYSRSTSLGVFHPSGRIGKLL